jgi:hypothetical protein
MWIELREAFLYKPLPKLTVHPAPWLSSAGAATITLSVNDLLGELLSADTPRHDKIN